MTSKTSQSKFRKDADDNNAQTRKYTTSDSDGKMNTTRVCIKGIPPNYDEMNLKRHLLQSSKFGGGSLIITDCKVLKNKQGMSRKMAFVGFKTSEMAEYVISYFHRTYAQTSRLVVEAALEKGGIESWNKKKRDKTNDEPLSSSSSHRVPDAESTRAIDLKKEEFLSVMMGGSSHTKAMDDGSGGRSSKFWANDDGGMLTRSNVQSGEDDEVKNMKEKEVNESVMEREKDAENGVELGKTKADTRGGEGKVIIDKVKADVRENITTVMSDMDFLRTKIVDKNIDRNTSGVVDDDKSATSSGSSGDSDNSSSSSSGNDSSSVPSSDSDDDDSDDEVDEGLNKGTAEKKSPSIADKQSGESLLTETMSEQHPHSIDPAIVTSNRLFLRNLPFCATADEIIEACSIGSGSEVVDCHIPIDDTKQNKGYAFVKFLSVDDAANALEKLDGTAFQGRLLHVLPGKEEINSNAVGGTDSDVNGMDDNGMMTTYKQAIELKKQQEAGNSTTGWSASYIRGDAVVDNLATRLGLTKGDILNVKDDLSSGDAAVRLALGETHVIEENRTFFRKHGIDMDALVPSSAESRANSFKRSQTNILVKNLPYSTTQEEITKVFHTIGGDVPTILLPPSRTIALVEYTHSNDAKRAFRKLAFKRFKHVPLYLEWAPLLTKIDNNGVVEDDNTMSTESATEKNPSKGGRASPPLSSLPNNDRTRENGSIIDEEAENAGHSCTLYIKNLNFKTTEAQLRSIFEEALGHVQAVKIPTKVAPVRKIRGGEDGKMKHLSMGYGFVEMKSEEMVNKAVKLLQGKLIDGHAVELKLSRKDSSALNKADAKPKLNDRQRTKLMVRNVPFQTTRIELLKLFGSFGQLRTVRLPKKFDGGHRGFAFVEFVTGNEAQNAMKALSQTHLYGRHLVLEWAEDKDDIETLRGKAQRDAHKVEDTNHRPKKKLRSDNFT